jgi:hypothetical protein
MIVFQRYQFATEVLLIGLALFVASSGLAQNLIKNPSFNDPIDPVGSSGTTNWTTYYVYGTADDFACHDRTTWAARTFGQAGLAGAMGGHFKPVTEGPMHGYFKQVVSGLTPGANYLISGWMYTTWQWGTDNGKFLVYMYVKGGLGDVMTPYAGSGGDDTHPVFAYYTLTNTARANGTIEVQLHADKRETFTPQSYTCNGCFDDISVTLLP